MQITVNGKKQEIQNSLTVSELLILNTVESPDMVSVQLNGEFVDRARFASTVINNNDEIDFLYFMGGGR